MADRTVLYRRSALGDVVLLGAVTGSLHEAVVVTDPRYIGVVERLRGVAEVHPWGARPQGRAVDLQGSLRSRWLVPWARRIRKRSLKRRLRLRWRDLAPRPTVPELYAEAVGVPVAELPWIQLNRRPTDRLVMAPGAAWPPKQWHPQRWVELGRRWEGPVTVVGGPGEGSLVDDIANSIPGAVALAESGFVGTFSVLEEAAVVVSGDSGLMHLAGACGVPVVGIFGPTHPDDGFWVYLGEVVQRDVSCRPCTLHRQPACPEGHHRCMDLAPDQVLEAARRCAGWS